MVNEKRVRLLQKGNETPGPIVYWMSRDQRVHDNWALIFSQQLALERQKPLLVLFNLVPNFLEATIRQYGFMLKGIEQLEVELKKYKIPFVLSLGNPEKEIPDFLKRINAAILVSDFDPLRIKRIWKRDVAKKISIPFYEVDAHNIVPCLYVSNKVEFGAYTIRPKIHKALPEFLDEFPKLKVMKNHELNYESIDWSKAEKSLNINLDVKEIDWLIPGEANAQKVLKDFLENIFDNYAEDRNDPNKNALSNLSPYLHFGQISAQRIALTVEQFYGNHPSAQSFLEELIVRRELSDNFCYFNPKYDSFDGFPDWAKNTLNEHRKDKREFVYSLEDFEQAKTHEDLWNAAQLEMVKTGKMHGYMRMYWAKKILEWSKSPEDALKIAIYLNDKYELDGRDPNGYVGCAWSVGGVHDRAWTERPVFGKIRYMNLNGAKRKFDVDSYIKKFIS
ncbi:deoxyribodipyrimidine photo-lyase [Ignavibacterium sp.]|uniref:deoxyribodipyrimidine photo-lyase n=1 Tax=Ignavibacterium sp. TaxID=2651167 RepID=UPI002200540D|nr:deoxyribodipyrimidine photo-lyase [Ignavibacterium sp.]BDQ03994.1 MAG: deoxyribodipyrimidine photo-lyase [Ignavibacterium sp.]